MMCHTSDAGFYVKLNIPLDFGDWICVPLQMVRGKICCYGRPITMSRCIDKPTGCNTSYE